MTSGTAPDADQLRAAFTRLLHRAGSHRGALGQPHPPRPVGAVHHRRHGAVQALLPRRRGAPVAPGPPRCRSASAPWTSTSWAPPSATAPSSRCWATSASATTSRPKPSLSPGSWSPRCWASTATGSGSPSTRATTKPSRSGPTRWAIPADRIQRLGDDNFWKMGDTGPCGPSSEIFFDKGPAYGADGRSGLRGCRAVRGALEPGLHAVQPQRRRHHRTDLPRPSIDTGAGLERILPVLQGVDSIFATDLFLPMIETAQSITGRTYGDDETVDVGPADPGRPRPGHVDAGGRRRAAGQRGPWLCPAPDHPTGGPPGPAARVRRARHHRAWSTPPSASSEPPIRRWPSSTSWSLDVVDREEDGFLRTLATGSTILEEELAAGAGSVSGDLAFRLHDTYGFPVELTVEIAEEAGVCGGPGRLRGGHGASSGPRPGRRPGPAGRPAGEQAYRSVLDNEGQTVFVGPAPRRLLGAGPGGGGAGRPGPRPPRARPRSSSTAPPSTPRAGGRWATPAPS